MKVSSFFNKKFFVDSVVYGMIFTLDINLEEREPNYRPVIGNSKIETLKYANRLKG